MKKRKLNTTDFEGKKSNILMDFVKQTQEGKFTEKIPEFTNISFTRYVIEEEDRALNLEEIDSNSILFGISN